MKFLSVSIQLKAIEQYFPVQVLFIMLYKLVITFRASDISRKKRQNFAGFSGANSLKNRPISRDFSGKQSNFEGFSGANS